MSAILVPLIASRFYRRIRSNIGRQKFSHGRSISVLMIFGVVNVLIAFSIAFGLNLLLAQAGGLVVGAAIGLAGLQLTEFEDTAEDRYYTPNSYLGVGVSVLLIGRIAYRIFVFSSFDQATQAHAPGLGQSPLTLGLFGLTTGYYIAYHAGLLAKRRGLRSQPPRVE